MGMVKFWDSRTATQLQSFQAHGADVLCLTISPVSLFHFTNDCLVSPSIERARKAPRYTPLELTKKWYNLLASKLKAASLRYYPVPPTGGSKR